MRVRPLRKIVSLALVIGSLAAPTVQAATVDYPTRPIRYVVAFAPGAINDIVARAVGQKLVDAWGQPVIVDNRPGAGGNVGAETVARSAPDGHTILSISSAHTIAQTLYPKLNYSLEKDLAPVALLASSPLIMVINPGMPVKSLRDFVGWAKANPMSFASGGVGTISHLAPEMFKQAAGVNGTHIPYKGGGLGALDVVAGSVTMMSNTLPTLMPFVKGGRLRAIGIMADKRHSLLPDVATFPEQGHKDFVMGNWMGIVAPIATPKPVIDKLASEVTRIVRSQEVRDRFLQEGADPIGGTPAEFGVMIRMEVERFGKAVKASGARVD
jgi:tripartite-type tricarboxylate transporter receptor subunit TctC